jgi:catalase
MSAEVKARLISSIGEGMRSVPREIQVRQIVHSTKADAAYGAGVAEALGISREERKTARAS